MIRKLSTIFEGGIIVKESAAITDGLECGTRSEVFTLQSIGRSLLGVTSARSFEKLGVEAKHEAGSSSSVRGALRSHTERAFSLCCLRWGDLDRYLRYWSPPPASFELDWGRFGSVLCPGGVIC
uniref:Uncharacterized protein n=1 Tax=Physcomitrium patens TaxID=3218 RepID=A0A7I4F0K9_PHYPA